MPDPGLVNWIPRMSAVYRDHIFHINLELIPKQPTGYGPADDPRYAAKNGPHCETLPARRTRRTTRVRSPAPGEVDDGVESDHGKNRVCAARGGGQPMRRGSTPRPPGTPSSWWSSWSSRLWRPRMLVVTIGNMSSATRRIQGGLHRRHRAQQGRRRPDRRRQGRQRPGASRCTTRRGPWSRSTSSRLGLNGGTNATIRYRNLVGQRYIVLSQGVGSTVDTCRARRDHPARPHSSGAGPDGPVQRVQAAVRSVVAGRRQQALVRDHPGVPGRGRHGREPAAARQPP